MGPCLPSHPAALSHFRHSSNSSLALCQARFPLNVFVHTVSSPGVFCPQRGTDFSPHSSLHSLERPFLTSWAKLAKPSQPMPLSCYTDLWNAFYIHHGISSYQQDEAPWRQVPCLTLLRFLGLEQDCRGTGFQKCGLDVGWSICWWGLAQVSNVLLTWQVFIHLKTVPT